MKQPVVKALLIITIVTVFLVFVANQIIHKMAENILLSRLAVFIKRWEGGLSRDPDDNASSDPAPWEFKGQTGWHTNKGITYKTFKNNAARLGYAPTADNFFNMPDSIFLSILKNVYAAGFPLDKIDHLPRIQAVIITWAWGSGLTGAERYLADFQREEMGIKDSNITKDEIVENFRARITPLNEKEWFSKLSARRIADFKNMSDWPKYGTGWTNRQNDFKKTFA
nr:glycosyl hydrolase 108 family protein [uncultured Fluviicola sp.]